MCLSAFVSTLGSHEIGCHKLPIIIITRHTPGGRGGWILLCRATNFFFFFFFGGDQFFSLKFSVDIMALK